MQINEYLKNVCEQIKYKPVRENISAELKLHIEEQKENFILDGMSKEKAELEAVKVMGEPKEVGKRLNKIHKPKLDWKLLILIFILAGYGIFVAMCKSKSVLENTITYMIVGLILGICVYFVDYRKIQKYSNLIYLIASLVVFLPIIGVFGNSVNGVNYFLINGHTYNTGIISVPLFIIAFIGFLNDFDNDKKFNISIKKIKIVFPKDILKITVFSIFSILLISMIPSIANGIVLTITYLVIGTVYITKKCEYKKKILGRIYGAMGILVILGLIVIFTNPYYSRKIITSFKPEVDPYSSGYVGMIQKNIIENAKLVGEYEADSSFMEAIERLIEDSNFTFIYLIAKFGILNAIILVIAIILVSVKLIWNSLKIKDLYGKLIIIGFGALYITQSIISVLMNINMGVSLNISLPFVSTGGTHFVVNAICIGVILSVYRRKDINFDTETGVGKYERVG